jgi:hypothetical protein
MIPASVVLIGPGEIGGVLARGFLKTGHSVWPVLRETRVVEAARDWPLPELVVVAVGESDLAGLLGQLPGNWRDRLLLLQNELLPADWSGVPDPTVMSVWFEKKPGMDSKPILSSPVFGPRADMVVAALRRLDLPAHRLADSTALLRELILKNLYILTSNIAGLESGGTVAELWRHHQPLARSVADEILDLQQALTATVIDRVWMIESLQRAFDGDPQHRCIGRSAPVRLERALAQAESLGLRLPTLRRIAANRQTAP